MAGSVTSLDRKLASWEALGYPSEYAMLIALQRVVHDRFLSPMTQDTALKGLQTQLLELNEKIDKAAKSAKPAAGATVTELPPQRTFDVRAK